MRLVFVISCLLLVVTVSAIVECHDRGAYLSEEDSCLCEDGFIGLDCRFNSSSEANCTAFSSIPVRLCDPGFQDDDCRVDTDECSSDPCLNGGTCQDQVNGFICLCLQGYSGLSCQIDVDECSSSPCHNGATCVDDINGLICLCPPGFSGSACQTNILECASDPCQNGAT
jgi:hypothetical protein